MAAWVTTSVGGSSPRAEPSGPAPLVTVMRRRPVGAADTASTSATALRRTASGGSVEAQSGGRALQPAQVAGERERLAVDGLQRLEHPVADQEAVVQG